MGIKQVGGKLPGDVVVKFIIGADGKATVDFSLNDESLTLIASQLLHVINSGGFRDMCARAVSTWGESIQKQDIAFEVLSAWANSEKMFRVKNPSGYPVTADTALQHLMRGGV